jgi:ATP-dependent helicase HrpA
VRTGLTTWPADLPALPDVLEATGPGGVVVRAYPTLVEEPDRSVAVRALADESAVPAAARAGLRRLLLLDVGLQPARITSRWTGTQALTLAASPYPSTNALVADVQLAAIDALVGPVVVRDADAYGALRAKVRDGLEDAVHQVVGSLVTVLTAWRELDVDLRGATSLALLATAQDVRAQANRLVHDGFVARTGAARLPQLTRYLRAAQYRLSKAADNPQRDADLGWQVRDAAEQLDTVRPGADPAKVDEVRWLLEELRVSLFAQQLGTPVPVSPTRIRKAIAAL